MVNDRGTYQPHFVKANVLGLSPYTSKTPVAEVLHLTGKDTTGQVLLTWTTAHITDDHFDVQRAADGKTFQTIATVEGADSTSLAHYQDMDSSPLTGINYYRIAVYNEDNKVNYSDTVQVNTFETANLVNFTAVADGSKVKIDWSTSSELNNSQFIVQNSLDNKNWSTLITVQGAGTRNTPVNYEAFDEHPFDGLNYYRLQYLFNSKDTTSAVRSVNMAQTLALNIYPNPAVTNIRFSVTGYQGDYFTAMLSDISGRTVYQAQFNRSSDDQYVLPVKPTAGVYVLKITGTALKKSAKVIVE